MARHEFHLNKRWILLLPLMVAISGSKVKGQTAFGVELRPRAEYRHGYKTLFMESMDPAAFVSQRTRLRLKHSSEWLSIGLGLQDIRTWGGTSQLNRSDDYLSLQEAWAEVDWGKGFALKLGRQVLSYDNQRILGGVNWAQQGRSHDIALLKWESAAWQSHAGIAFNQFRENLFSNKYTLAGSYKTMQFIWINHTFEPFEWSLLFLNNGLQYFTTPGEEEVRYSQTLGAYFMGSIDKFQASLSAYYQLGEDIDAKTIRAYQLFAEISYSLSGGFTPMAGLEILSGTHESDMLNADYNQNNSFTPLYGTNHKFNGSMDYFFSGNYLNNAGLVDVYGKLVYKKGKFTAGLDVHYFTSHTDILDSDPPGEWMDRYLGTEADLYFHFQFREDVRISAGYSQMFATETMQEIKGGDQQDIQNWGWLMFTFTPEFFNPE
jgi:hypothetical protein